MVIWLEKNGVVLYYRLVRQKQKGLFSEQRLKKPLEKNLSFLSAVKLGVWGGRK